MSLPETLTSRVSPLHSSLRCDLLERTHASFEPQWESVAELLRKAFQGDHCTIVLHHTPSSFELLGSAGIAPEWGRRYEEGFVGSHPLIAEVLRRRPNGGDPYVTCLDALMPLPQLKQTPFFHRFYTAVGVNDAVGVVVFEGPRPLAHLSIRRKSNGLRYGQAEEARLRSISDILSSAIHRSHVLRLVNARLAAYDRLTARTQGGLIIFDERGEVVEAEGAGRELVSQRRPLLADLFARFEADPTQARGTLPKGGDRAAQDRPAPADLEFEFRKVTIEGRVRVLCILAAPTGAAPAAPNDRVQLPPDVHFTARERDVLMLLSRGLDNLSIARQLGIGLYTTKDHVKAIFRKLSVKTRAEAVAVLARQGNV